MSSYGWLCRNGPDAEGARNFLVTSLGPSLSGEARLLLIMANSVMVDWPVFSMFATLDMYTAKAGDTSRSYERPP